MNSSSQADLLVIGGGPAGSTTALRASRNGLRTRLFEQARHPRFHIGESFLPRNLMLIRELGLLERLARIPQVRKVGASFAMGSGGDTRHFHFEEALLPHNPETFNIERAPFDDAMLDAARESGTEVVENATVSRITRLKEGDVAVEVRTEDGEVTIHRGRCLADASGQSTVVGRHLKTRVPLPDLKMVAYFGHFKNVFREDGDLAGYPAIVICDEGWFWLIPIDEERTSIGLVMDSCAAKSTGVPPKEMLAWGISRSPQMRERTRDAEFPEEYGVTADFSYNCRPYSGPGYFLVGDSATFIDPIFSTGVCLGMMSAVQAADGVAEILTGKSRPSRVRRRYNAYVEGSSSTFLELVRHFYTHSFRELIMNREGPLEVHRAVISLLCGHVFPRPPFAVRWRMKFLKMCILTNRYLQLVPRVKPFSLIHGSRDKTFRGAVPEPSNF